MLNRKRHAREISNDVSDTVVENTRSKRARRDLAERDEDTTVIAKTRCLPPELAKVVHQLQEQFVDKMVKQLLVDEKIKAFPEGTEITDESYVAASRKHEKDEKNLIAERVINDVPLSFVAEVRDEAKKIDYAYSHTLDRHPLATNQHASGRCWLFSGLNTMRFTLMRKFNLPDTFELSEAFLFFYDKFERCNSFLERLIELRDQEDNAPELVALLSFAHPISDGGTFEYFRNLVLKYGIVPKTCYGECYNSSCTDEMNDVLTKKLAQYTSVVRTKKTQTPDQLRKLKDNKFLPEIYSILRKFMGTPPEKFDWSYYEDSYGSNGPKTHHLVEGITPIQFFQEYVNPSYRIEDKVVLIHDPRKETKLYHKYITSFSNMVGAKPNVYVPVTLDDMKQAAIRSIENLEACWIACDVGKDFCSHRCLLSSEIYDVDRVLNTDLALSKEDQLRYRYSAPTHAMVLVGVDQDSEGRSKKWRIENSWGPYGEEDPGYLQMSDGWFDNYMYELVVDKECVPDDATAEIKKHEEDVLKFHYLDPFGEVA